MLDTGSEANVVPARYVSNRLITPSERSLNAANGTAIPVLGEATLNLVLGVVTIPVRCLISEHVDEILLGLGFLEGNGCV